MDRLPNSWVILIALAGVGGGASSAWAHKLLIDCKVEGDRVHIEAFYDNDTPAQDAKIVLESADKKALVEGRTNERGVWICSAPRAGKYTVRAESVGHAASESLTISEAASTPKNASSTSFDGPTNVRHPSREEKTETPWRETLLGFGVIIALCFLAILIRKKTNRKPPSMRAD